MANSDMQSETAALLLAQSQVDALIRDVREQLRLGSFNPNDRPLLERLVNSFEDKRGMVRLAIAETLGESIGKPATPVLIEGLRQHPNPVVRRACAKTLTLIADPVAIPDLIHAMLHDDDTVVHGSAVGALARVGESAVPRLLEILAADDAPETTKGHIAWALAFIGSEASEHLHVALNSELPDVRAAVVGAMGSIIQERGSDEQAFNALLEALNDPASAVRAEAVAALGKLDPSHDPLPHLVKLLSDENGDVRKTTALSLMKLGNLAALSAIGTAIETESDDGVTRVMKFAFSQLETTQDEDDDWD